MDFVYDLPHLDSPGQNVTSIKTRIFNHFFSAAYSEQYLTHNYSPIIMTSHTNGIFHSMLIQMETKIFSQFEIIFSNVYMHSILILNDQNTVGTQHMFVTKQVSKADRHNG